MSGILKPGGVVLQGAAKQDDRLGRHIHHLQAGLIIRNHGAQEKRSLSPNVFDEEQIGDAVRSLEQMFPDFSPGFATSVLKIHLGAGSIETALQRAADDFLQLGCSKSSGIVDGASASNATAVKVADKRDPCKEKEVVDLTVDDEVDHGVEKILDAELYEEWCIHRLAVDFPRIALPSLKTALKLFEGKLDPTYKAVNWHYERVARKSGAESAGFGVVVDQGLQDSSWLPKGKLRLLKHERFPKLRPLTECPRYESEWKVLQSELQLLEELDVPSSNVLEQPAPSAGIECGCCYGENLFEELVQCADGHLFCTSCLRRHLEGYIFGGAQACGLPLCLDTNGCDKTFPWSEVKRALPPDVLSKYEQRQAEDAVARAQLEGLVYCPFCNHPWEVDRGMAVLRCHNEGCKKASCIKCKEPDHLPQRCEEVEKKSETAMRRKVEELMTRALIRVCTSCKAELVKLDGCNKIMCRCGQTLCYVCRKPITDYAHFCQHAREPGKPCKSCSGCSLWEKENEAEVVQAAKKAAIQEVGAQEPGLLTRDIGPSEVEKAFKKPRVGPFVPH